MQDYSDDHKEIARKIVGHFNRLIVFAGAAVLLILIQIINPKIYSVFLSDSENGVVEITEVELDDEDKIENGIHLASGLIVDEGYELVVTTCGSCHSYKLVTQNRGDQDDWRDIIHWMQETQKLWDLGSTEEPIVQYLAKNYGPTKKSRRANLTDIEWYELE